MSKKQLLSESEIRRFMTLANLGGLTETVLKENYSVGENSEEAPKEMEEAYAEDSAPESDDSGEEMLDLDTDADSKEINPMILKGMEMMLKGATGKDFDLAVDSEEAEGAEEPEVEEPEEQPEEDDESSDEEPSDEEPSDEEPEDEEEMQEAFIQNVVERVSARLVAEAQKAKKKGKKVLNGGEKDEKPNKKKSVADKMKEMKRKKIAEANAPAPKSTNSNGPKKGAGSATKGTFGVTSKVSNQEWGKDKGGHELETVSASSEHMVSHGKNNLATKGKK